MLLLFYKHQYELKDTQQQSFIILSVLHKNLCVYKFINMLFINFLNL